MNKSELVAKAERGERITRAESPHVLYDAVKPGPCQHRWRVVVCDDSSDVIECSQCGDQRTVACNFDEEFS